MKTSSKDWTLYRQRLDRRLSNYQHCSVTKIGLDWHEPIIGPKVSPVTGKGRLPTTKEHARASGFFGW